MILATDIAMHGSRAALRRRSGGFTLIEMLTVLTILVILLTFAVPSFLSQVRRWRASNELATLVSDLQFARAEAIRRGQATSLCVSTDGKTCLGSRQWELGWIVMSDPAATGVAGPKTSVLRVRTAWNSGDRLVGPSGLSRVSFTGDGFASNLPAGSVTLPLRATPGSNAATRCVSLNLAGRITVLAPGEAACS